MAVHAFVACENRTEEAVLESKNQEVIDWDNLPNEV